VRCVDISARGATCEGYDTYLNVSPRLVSGSRKHVFFFCPTYTV
jgi:hypothetical protein